MNLQEAKQYLTALDAMRAEYAALIRCDERMMRSVDRRKLDDLAWAFSKTDARTEQVLRELVDEMENTHD